MTDITPIHEPNGDPYYYWWNRLVASSKCKEMQWQALPAAHRAILKRCKDLEDVMLSEPFQLLWLLVPEEKRSPAKMEEVALIAWTLSAVKEDVNRSLAKSMALKTTDSNERPKVSVLRFQQLIKSRDISEFSRRIRRILVQLDHKVSVAELSKEIKNWYWQNRSPNADTSPAKRQVLQWAMDYYAAAPKDKSHSTERK